MIYVSIRDGTVYAPVKCIMGPNAVLENADGILANSKQHPTSAVMNRFALQTPLWPRLATLNQDGTMAKVACFTQMFLATVSFVRPSLNTLFE